MFNLLLISGHGQGDSGAVGNGYRECDLTRKITTNLKSCASAFSDIMKVTVFNTDLDCYNFLKIGNDFNFARYDYVLEIHLNASTSQSSRGTLSIINDNEIGQTVEEEIIKNLVKLGTKASWNSNGIVKAPSEWGYSLLVNSNCRSQGVSHSLLETCFISNKEDVNWLLNNLTPISKAILNGIVKGFGLKITSKPNADIYNVQVGSFSVKDNAYNLRDELVKRGYKDTFVTIKKGG